MTLLALQFCACTIPQALDTMAQQSADTDENEPCNPLKAEKSTQSIMVVCVCFVAVHVGLQDPFVGVLPSLPFRALYHGETPCMHACNFLGTTLQCKFVMGNKAFDHSIFTNVPRYHG